MNKLLTCLAQLGAVALFFSCESADNFELQDGDILFQDLDCGVYCESIESVTRGYGGANLSHCGIVYIENGRTFVLEAISKGVSQTPLDSFLNRSYDDQQHPKVFVGRVKEQHIAESATALAVEYLGRAYDPIYNINDERYYCSELVYYSFLRDGNPIFDLQAMTFKALNTDSTFADWIDYFEELQVPIPEGEPGLNPGGISLSNELDIVHFFGHPDGLK